MKIKVPTSYKVGSLALAAIIQLTGCTSGDVGRFYHSTGVAGNKSHLQPIAISANEYILRLTLDRRMQTCGDFGFA